MENNFEIFPVDLVRQFVKGNGVIYLGSELSEWAGLSIDKVRLELARDLIDCPPDVSLFDLAHFYSLRFSEFALHDKLRQVLHESKSMPTPAHFSLLKLPVKKIFTLAYDNLTETALTQSMIPFNRIVEDHSVSFVSTNQITFIKLMGSLDEPASIIITSRQVDNYRFDHPSILRTLASTLQTQTVLFLGYSKVDPILKYVLPEVQDQSGKFLRNFYTVQFDIPDWKKSDFEDKGIKVINIKPQSTKVTALSEWLEEFASQINHFEGGISRVSPLVDTLYRDWLKEYTDSIDIRGIGVGSNYEAYRIPLQVLYTELFVSSKEDTEQGNEEGLEERESLSNAVLNQRCTTITGEPGSGKTTFLRYFSRKLSEDFQMPLPLLAKITDIFSFIHNSGKSETQKPERDWFLSYWMARSEENEWGFQLSSLKNLFEQGKVILLLDALDELPNEKSRQLVIGLLEIEAKRWDKCRWVITSRPGVLVGKSMPLDFTLIKIGSFSQFDIQSFINSWVKFLFSTTQSPNRLYRSAQAYASELNSAIREQPEVKRIAQNPVMLTAIAVVHWNERKIPEGKAELYEAIVDWLVKSHSGLPNHEDTRLIRNCYNELAFRMFTHPNGRQIEVGLLWGAEILKSYFDNQIDKALQFLENDEFETGIIVHNGEGNISFRHLSFQEFFAASLIAKKTDDETDGWWADIKDVLYQSEWAEVLGFLLIRLLKMGDARVDLFVKRFFTTVLTSGNLAEIARGIGWFINYLHSLANHGYSINKVKEFSIAKNRTMEIFTSGGKDIDLIVRLNAALVIGQTGDLRFVEPQNNWIFIQGGKNWIGSQGSDPDGMNYDSYSTEAEQPPHVVFTPPFEIGKYPVTVFEYQKFIEAGGYRRQEFWDNAGWNWCLENKVNGPDNWDDQLNFPNCPIVDIGWHEALAYCSWLSMQDPKFLYRLPTEAEWEYTARRNQKEYTRFCFGNDAPHEVGNKFNWDSGKLRHIAPVGLFLQDSSMDGVMDMAGNIKEFTLSPGYSHYTAKMVSARAGIVVEPGDKVRVVRGTSWNYMARCGRSAFRTRVTVTTRYFDIGFRVVRLPKPVAIKGRLPSHSYHVSLPEVFYLHYGEFFSIGDAQRSLEKFTGSIPGLSVNILYDLFPNSFQEYKAKRLPFVLQDAQPTKLGFNLEYQDSRLKLAIEERLGLAANPLDYDADMQTLSEALSILLFTEFQNQILWLQMTDNDLDAQVFTLLDLYDPDRKQRLLSAGYRTNGIAISVLPDTQKMRLFDLFKYQIQAGSIWWSEQSTSFDQQFPKPIEFAIADFSLLLDEISKEDRILAFIFDDNGELVWDLAVIQRLLFEYSSLKIIGILNDRVIINNANILTLQNCLENPCFESLAKSSRFSVFIESHQRSSIDMPNASQRLLQLLEKVHAIYIKGTAAFETMQYLPAPTFYSFVNLGQDIQKYTGIEQGKGVFVRVPPKTFAYEYGVKTLSDCYPFENATEEKSNENDPI